MSRRICTSTIAALVYLALGLMMGCAGGSHVIVETIAITPTGGSGQNTTVGATFADKLVAKVTTGGSPSRGVSVTFTAPSSGAGGTFANGMATETDATDANGNATSSTFTANTTSGVYMVAASVAGAAAPANFKLTNSRATGQPFVFYLSGEETANATNGGNRYYALAGSVLIDPSGNVLGGEEDYNDGSAITQSALSITSGKLTVSATGQGTLTLVTSNGTATQQVGIAGTETLGVQFVNAKHALIAQFDGSATSSGSMDLQSATSAPNGDYAFTLSGVDSNYNPVGYGGIFESDSTTVNGSADVNDNGTIVTNTAFSGALLAPDGFGRGQTSGIVINGTTITLSYYVVGPEVIRIIDMDVTGQPGIGGAAMGSAFGRGCASCFSNESLGPSVVSLGQTDPLAMPYAAVGMFTTNSNRGAFSGFGDADQPGAAGPAPIGGSYSIGSTGYGELHDTTGWESITQLGMYMTDPTLNLLDPNNPTGGGGALLLELDPNDVHFSGVNLVGGVGIVIPQTDTSTASFAGNYAFGAQDFNTLGSSGSEFDLVGVGAVGGAPMAFAGTGLVNDDLEYFAATPARYTAVPFSGTVTPDLGNVGRYTISPLAINAVSGGANQNFTVAIYQANGGQLIWLDEDTSSVFVGPLEQQGSHTGMPAAKKARVKHTQ